MSGPIGVALLGAGIFAKEAHIPAIASLVNSQHVSLKAVYSRSSTSTAALANLAQETLSVPATDITSYSDDAAGLDELLARQDISAVIIVLPLTHQPDIVLKALKAGKHVLSEKPVAKDVESALNLIKTYESEYKSKGLIWRVAENFECEPGIQAAAEIIKSGKIGNVAFFKLSAVNFLDQTSKYYQTSWRTIPEYQGGFLLDGGVHSAALLRTVLPSSIASLSGHSSLIKDYLLPHDTIQSILKLSSGAHGIFELSFAAPSQSRAEMIVLITGTAGHLAITSEQRVVEGGSQGETKPHYILKLVGADGKEEVSAYANVGVRKEIEYFVKAIQGDADKNGEPRGALRDVAIIQAALTSNGHLVDIGKLVQEI